MQYTAPPKSRCCSAPFGTTNCSKVNAGTDQQVSTGELKWTGSKSIRTLILTSVRVSFSPSCGGLQPSLVAAVVNGGHGRQLGSSLLALSNESLNSASARRHKQAVYGRLVHSLILAAWRGAGDQSPFTTVTPGGRSKLGSAAGRRMSSSVSRKRWLVLEISRHSLT